MKVIHIEGMSCEHCVMRVKKALESIPEVKLAEVILDEKQAKVDLDGAIDEGILKGAVEAAGYQVTGIA